LSTEVQADAAAAKKAHLCCREEEKTTTTRKKDMEEKRGYSLLCTHFSLVDVSLPAKLALGGVI